MGVDLVGGTQPFLRLPSSDYFPSSKKARLALMLLTSGLIPGNWYISLVCACRRRLILFRDLTEGKGNLQGVYTLTCPACGAQGSYTAEHYQHKPTAKALKKVASDPIWVLDSTGADRNQPVNTKPKQPAGDSVSNPEAFGSH
jgi:hypothetical protein